MRVRLLVALLAVFGVTAFAPAPFVKSGRIRDRDEGDPQLRLQGTWAIKSKERMGPNGALTKYPASTTQKLLIEKDAWSFVYSSPNNFAAKMPARPLYRLEVEQGTRPIRFRVKRTLGDRDYMVGILAFEGETVKMLYRLSTIRAGTEEVPANFDKVPENWYLMTLERDK